MKVLFVLHYPGFGGANQSAFHLMLNLRRRHNVEPVVLSSYEGEIVDRCRGEGIASYVIRYASWRGGRSGIKRIAYAILMLVLNVFALPRAMRLVKKERIDIIHINSSMAFFGWMLGKVCRKKVVWHLREFGSSDYPMSFYLGEACSGRIIGSSSAVIAISESIRDYYARFVHPNGVLRVVYNGVDVESSMRKVLEPEPDLARLSGFKICMLGGVTQQKNHIEVVKALEILRDRGVFGINFYIIGGCNTDYGSWFEDYVRQSEVADAVHVLGEHSNVWPLITHMDIGVVPSLNEAFGRVAVEFMLCGIPVVASKAGALPEIIDDGETGYLYDVGNPAALANIIDRLRFDSEKGKIVGQKAQQKASTTFNAAVNADKIYEIYTRH